MNECVHLILKYVMKKTGGTMYKKIKRIMDIFFSSIFLMIGAIPLLLVAILVKMDSQGPALFKQERLGVNGTVFKIYKFRSMVLDAEHQGSGVYSGKTDARVTRIGRILRSTSIDELPQIINIFKGERGIIETTEKSIDFSRVVAG